MIRDGWQATLRPVEHLSPSEWAERYRYVDFGPFRGHWRNANGPHLVGLMDAVEEALLTGRDLVVIKGAQEGVTEAIGVNAVAWLLSVYGGPVLYLTSKDDIAKKLVRDRWEHTLKSCRPLAAKHLAGKTNGETILSKRFTDGSLQLSGSVSLLNFLSNPYAVIVFDELDSCQDEMPDGSDPIALIRERLTAMAEGRPVLLIAFAHPTSRERGAAKLYYEHSDQRRAHVVCPHCSRWVAPLWEHVRVLPRDGQALAAAERDPTCYQLVAPCCGVVWSDADRRRAIRRVEQRSTLAPEVAATKRWIGCHVWHLFLRNAGQVEELARKRIEGLDDPGVMRVFWNKSLGEPYDEEVEETSLEAWQALQVDSYRLGEVPPEVSFLTAGQDSNLMELHWIVWGWGLVRTEGGALLLCGSLIDCGIEPGPAANDRRRKTVDVSDLLGLDAAIYNRAWPRQDVEGEHLEVAKGFHDSGWAASTIAVYEYALLHPNRAFPSKGAGLDDHSRAPAVTWSAAPKWKIDGEEVSDPSLKRADLNTYMLKVDLVGQVSKRFVAAGGGPPRARLALPEGTPPELFEHLASERLVLEKNGKRVWKRRGPNHWLDCTVQAYAAALQLAPFLEGRTREDRNKQEAARAEERARRQLAESERRRAPVRARPVRRSY